MSCGITFRKPLIVLIPDGYTGWVRVENGVASEPPFLLQDGRNILKIPAEGLIRTSSTFEPGYEGDLYFYVSPDGRRTPLKQESGAGDTDVAIQGSRMFTVAKSAGEEVHIFGAFFVGSRADFGKATKDVSGLPAP